MAEVSFPNPGRLLKISGAYWESCALHAALRLDLFTAVSDASVSSASLARKLKADPRAVEMLMNALASMGLLTKTADRYMNTPEAAVFLSRQSDRYMGYIIRHHAYLLNSWSRLDEAVAGGGPVRRRTSLQDKTVRRDFLMGMFNLAMGLGPVVAETVNLGDRSRLLDLGGGPGTYAIHFCLKNPNLEAVVLDLATTRPFAEETIGRFGLHDRITFLDGDYLEDEIPGQYDAVWMSHILHAEGPETCRAILRKAVGSLDKGGAVLIHDFLLDDTMDGPLFPALFSLNMLLGTAEGQAYSDAQIRNMMSEAGVSRISRIPLASPNDSGILSGVVLGIGSR